VPLNQKYHIDVSYLAQQQSCSAMTVVTKTNTLYWYKYCGSQQGGHRM